ncbi:hypothetical protein GCM10010842_34230 [Deinococcus daejeonensis]|uniref:Uncharacterized protein n=1 Tax=Deinococcus daejeonensis TaxID=1007098 RepID=A0ABQ2JGQ8_9DEIO|nr:hypothetical protein GCM10010842_34230 [Deinococcus daejeonensis]
MVVRGAGAADRDERLIRGIRVMALGHRDPQASPGRQVGEDQSRGCLALGNAQVLPDVLAQEGVCPRRAEVRRERAGVQQVEVRLLGGGPAVPLLLARADYHARPAARRQVSRHRPRS